LVDLFARGLAWEGEAAGGTRSIGICPVQPWLNVPDLGFGVLAYAEDAGRAAEIVDELADRAWGRRAALFDFPLLTPAEAAEAAFAAPGGPIVLSDAADSTGSGATGDGTAVLAALVAAADRRPSFVSVVDAVAVGACHAAGRGAEIEVRLGASLDPVRHRPLTLHRRVHWAGDGFFRCEGPQWHGRRMRGGRAACLRAGRHQSVAVVVSERPCFVWDPGFYRMAGLDVSAAQVVVVKSAVAYRAAFGGIAAGSIVVDGPGASPSNLHRVEVELNRVQRPLYPFDGAAHRANDS
ncbi:MAG: MlrC C-terminal domain-containing protein, partial [Chloroflexota bacterium]